MKFSPRFATFGIIFTLILFVFFLMLSAHFRAKSAVAAYRAQLKSQGEKITIAEFAPRISAEEAAAGRSFLAVADALGSISNYPPTMHWVAPGHALVGWRELDLATDECSNLWPYLIFQIQTNRQKLDALCSALRSTTPRFDLAYSNGFTLQMPHLGATRTAALWLSAAVIEGLHRRRFTNAFDDLKMSLATCRTFEREPLIISQMVRDSIGQINLSATWEQMQAPEWQDEQLLQLQTAWDSTNFMDEFEAAFSMERAMRPIGFALLRRSATNLYGDASSLNDVGRITDNPKGALDDLMNFYPRFWTWKWWTSYDEELHSMQIDQAAIMTLREMRRTQAFVPARMQYEAESGRIDSLHSNAMPRYVMGSQSTMIDHLLLKAADMECERRILVAAIALKRYKIREGAYPNQLQDLVPKYLASVPHDFMDGKPLRYHPISANEYLLYSVGEDGIDDGGNSTSTQPSTVHSKQWVKGIDAVWPMPATDTEAKAYQTEMQAKLRASSTQK